MEKTNTAQTPTETQSARIFDLVCDIWKHRGPDVRQFVEEKIKPLPKEYLWALGRIVLISFIPSMSLIWLGFSVDSFVTARWLLFFGGMWRAACTVVLLLALTPIGLIIEAVLGGKEGIGKRWVETISGTFIGELFFTLIVMILLPYLKANLGLLPLLLMASMILGMAGGTFFGKGFVAGATGIITVAVVIAIVFPGPINRLLGELDETNSLQHFEIDPAKLEDRTVAFFNSDGSPRAWYALIITDEKNKVGYLELFTREAYHPGTKEKLKPVTREVADFIFEKKTGILHPVNIKKAGSQAGAQSSATVISENRKPPPGKILVAHPPEIDSQIDLSKPWKFRYEVRPGYQRYTQRAFSEWAPARIERWDSKVKIDILESDGSVKADFNGTKTGPDAYKGSWSMRDGSGRGEFNFSLENPNLISGSINDVTVDQSFIPMELRVRSDAQARNYSKPRTKSETNRDRYGRIRKTDTRKEMAVARRPAVNEPRRTDEPRSTQTVSPTPEYGYRKAATVRRTGNGTSRPAPSVTQSEIAPRASPTKSVEAKSKFDTVKAQDPNEKTDLSVIDEWAPDFEELKRELKRKD